MSSSSSNLLDNLSDRIHGDKCTDCKSYLDYVSIKNNHLICRRFDCKRFANIYEFCDRDINKFFCY